MGSVKYKSNSKLLQLCRNW